VARTALTALTVQKLKPPTKKTDRVERYDAAVKGFGVRITPEGSRSWILVYTSPTKRKRRRYTIGLVDLKTPDGETTLNLDQAREKAVALRRMVRAGHDPADERETTKAAIIAEAQATETRTFRAVVDRYDKRDLINQKRGWEVRQIIERELVPYWGNKQISAIGPEDIEERVEALLDAGKPAAARRLFATARQVFNWAFARPSYRLTANPVDRMQASKLLGEARKRTRTLNNDELAALWRAAERLQYPCGPMICLLMMSALRRSEAAEAVWSEFGLASRQWVIPATRMKGGAAHCVPLTDDMLALLEGLPRIAGCEFLFTATGRQPWRGFSIMKRQLDRLMLEELRKIVEQRGEDPAKVKLDAWVLHDIRRTVRTHLSALPVPELVRELLLAHARPGLHQVYDQHAYVAEKLAALKLWGQKLKSIIEPPTDNVVVMRAVR
jgi:integrase